MPMMRPMWVHYPDDPNTFDMDDQVKYTLEPSVDFIRWCPLLIPFLLLPPLLLLLSLLLLPLPLVMVFLLLLLLFVVYRYRCGYYVCCCYGVPRCIFSWV